MVSCAWNETQAPYGSGCAFWLKLHWPLLGPEVYLGAMAENTTTTWPLPRAPQKTPLLWLPTTLVQVLIVKVSRHVR
jgi:hypothetical protein